MNFILEKLAKSKLSPLEEREKGLLSNASLKDLILLSPSADARWYYFYQRLEGLGINEALIDALKNIGIFLSIRGFGPEHLLYYSDDELKAVMNTFPELLEDYFTQKFIRDFAQAMIGVMAKIEKK